MITYLQQLGRTARTRSESEAPAAPSEHPAPPAQIWDNRWLITIVAVLVTALGIVYGLSVTPVYQANTLIQIKRNAPLSGEAQGEMPVATEVEILRSRSIASSVVDALQLDINVEPRRFPVIGRYIAGKSAGISEQGLFGAGGWAWGTEQAQVAVFNVPEALHRQPLLLTVADKGGFILGHPGLGLQLRGQVGQLASARTSAGMVEILVTEIQALPETQFLVSRTPKFQAVEQLQKSLTISENGKQSNVIGISLRGSKPELISRILNEIGNQYIRQQIHQRSEDARKSMLFYNRKIEESRLALQRLDARLSQLLRSRGIADLGEEAKALAQQAVALQAELALKEQRRTELAGRYLQRHPEVLTVTTQIHDIGRHLREIEAKQEVLAEVQRDVLGLNRDKQINSEIHAGLLNTRNKLEAQAQSSDLQVRLLDRAESPMRSVTLGLPVMAAMACLLGIVLGVLASIVKNALIAASLLRAPGSRQTAASAAADGDRTHE